VREEDIHGGERYLPSAKHGNHNNVTYEGLIDLRRERGLDLIDNKRFNEYPRENEILEGEYYLPSNKNVVYEGIVGRSNDIEIVRDDNRRHRSRRRSHSKPRSRSHSRVLSRKRSRSYSRILSRKRSRSFSRVLPRNRSCSKSRLHRLIDSNSVFKGNAESYLDSNRDFSTKIGYINHFRLNKHNGNRRGRY